jgi:RNA polymerase sigma-70 factor (ECF subfamily)
MDEIRFEETLRGARDGQRQCLTALYSAYNPMLVRYLRMQAPGAGEDLAQETWLEVAPKLHDFRADERDFRIMLLTIARRQVARYRKGNGQVPTTLMSPRALTGVTRHIRSADAREADAALRDLLSGLKPLHAEILLLRVVGGLTAEETAALVGKSPGAVRVMQHRALRRLADRLGQVRVGA